MTEANLEIVRAGYEAFNRRDFDVGWEMAHESVTWKPLFSVETDVLRGKEAVQAAWRSQVEALDLRVDLLELRSLDEHRVLALGRWSGKGSGSGALVERTGAQLFTFDGGLIASVETFATRDAALEAAGLSE